MSSATAPADPLPFVESIAGSNRLHLMVDGVHCGGCVRKIEQALRAVPEVEEARVNLTTRRLTLRWRGDVSLGGSLAGLVHRLGYNAVPFDPARLQGLERDHEKRLLRCLAVAGFAAANVMLLAVSVWAGHFQGMGDATRDLLHWFEALIALPAIAFAGRPFFGSAMQVLRAGRTNMDVPISLAVILAGAMSLFETMRGGEHVYFDSAITLLFFLLIGRYLDARARGSATAAAQRLVALGAGAVTEIMEDGTTRVVRPEDLQRGARILVAMGERIGADGTLLDAAAEIDTSAITGESVPQRIAAGERVFAGTVNLGHPVEVRVIATGEGTLLAEIVRLMEHAEQKRGRFVTLADRISALYAPLVHTLAAVAFLGWWLFGGLAWQEALLIAIAVLVITCPCALGLAVPAVQVIASGRLMRQGILLKSATALERLAQVDTVVFDKTGTLTEGSLELVSRCDRETLELAAGIAKASRHPLARALAAACPEAVALHPVKEVPGSGLIYGEIRLGRADWAASEWQDDGDGEGRRGGDGGEGPELWLARPDQEPVRFAFSDKIRSDAAQTIDALSGRGIAVGLLSGDREPVVTEMARALGIERFHGRCSPPEKVRHLEALATGGARVMMVGDGLNDAPALAAAHVSVSPSSAVEISQTTADAVFQGSRLRPVVELLDVARAARRLVLQNLALAFTYNALTIPLAMAGLVTPLVAAIAMSTSSLLVVGNALRVGKSRSYERFPH